MTEYKCDVCWAEFETNRPSDAMCPACGEFVEERDVELTDREGKFPIGGKVTPINND